MYSLVHVCLFCSQFFDPDFPGGIAFPTRTDVPVPKTKDTLGAIASQSLNSPMIKYYDTRYLAHPIEVGQVLMRPSTSESRQRAQRARTIQHKFETRQAEIAEAAIVAEKKNNKSMKAKNPRTVSPLLAAAASAAQS